jgi:hypothetical protein
MSPDSIGIQNKKGHQSVPNLLKQLELKPSSFEERFVVANNSQKKILVANAGHVPIFVIPHLNYYTHCLNSDDSIQKVGELINQYTETKACL